jgi:hypothetical protein
MQPLNQNDGEKYVTGKRRKEEKKNSIQTSGTELANMIFASTPVPYHADWSMKEHGQPTEV